MIKRKEITIDGDVFQVILEMAHEAMGRHAFNVDYRVLWSLHEAAMAVVAEDFPFEDMIDEIATRARKRCAALGVNLDYELYEWLEADRDQLTTAYVVELINCEYVEPVFCTCGALL